MAQQISDLVINLDVDSATFTEQIARIKGQLSGMADESDKVQTRMRSAAEAQISALKTTSAASAGAVSDMQKRQADAAAGLQNELQRVSKSVDETYQRVTGLNQRYRENDAQAEALARRQDALAESFFRQIDGVRSLSGETRSLASVQEQFRKARAQGNITQGDYLSLISRTTARQKELQQVEEKANQAREKFLRQLKAQVVEQKLSGTELLRMKAAQVGAGDAAEVYIRKLEAAKVATHSLGLESAGARRELGVLAGELLRGNFGALRGSGIQGMASDDISAYYDQLTDAIKETPAWEEVQRDIEETHQQLTETADAISEDVARQISAVNQNIDETVAAQIRGSTDSNSLADLRSGLLYQEMNARITADAAEVTARESLQTQFNENKASVAEELSSISTAQSAQASKISGLETSLGKKADASALQSLTQKVEQQGTTLTSQGSTLTSLTNRIGKAESGVAANSNAITGLQSTVSQQGNTLTSQGSAITKLQNDLSVTNDTLGKKADAASVSSLTNRVDAAERSITSQSASITELNNSVSQPRSHPKYEQHRGNCW